MSRGDAYNFGRSFELELDIWEAIYSFEKLQVSQFTEEFQEPAYKLQTKH